MSSSSSSSGTAATALASVSKMDATNTTMVESTPENKVVLVG